MIAAFPRRHKLTITEYERRLQKQLQKEGRSFTAQARIRTKSGRTYTVDLRLSPTLVVEVGFINKIDIQEHEDLRQTGITVLHFPNKEIEHNLRSVIATIKNTLSYEVSKPD